MSNRSWFNAGDQRSLPVSPLISFVKRLHEPAGGAGMAADEVQLQQKGNSADSPDPADFVVGQVRRSGISPVVRHAVNSKAASVLFALMKSAPAGRRSAGGAGRALPLTMSRNRCAHRRRLPGEDCGLNMAWRRWYWRRLSLSTDGLRTVSSMPDILRRVGQRTRQQKRLKTGINWPVTQGARSPLARHRGRHRAFHQADAVNDAAECGAFRPERSRECLQRSNGGDPAT